MFFLQHKAFVFDQLRACIYAVANCIASAVRADFDWNACYNKLLPAPWVPKVKSAFDPSNFEPAADDHDPMPYIDDGSRWEADF